MVTRTLYKHNIHVTPLHMQNGAVRQAVAHHVSETSAALMPCRGTASLTPPEPPEPPPPELLPPPPPIPPPAAAAGEVGCVSAKIHALLSSSSMCHPGGAPASSGMLWLLLAFPDISSGPLLLLVFQTLASVTSDAGAAADTQWLLLLPALIDSCLAAAAPEERLLPPGAGGTVAASGALLSTQTPGEVWLTVAS